MQNGAGLPAAAPTCARSFDISKRGTTTRLIESAPREYLHRYFSTLRETSDRVRGASLYPNAGSRRLNDSALILARALGSRNFVDHSRQSPPPLDTAIGASAFVLITMARLIHMRAVLLRLFTFPLRFDRFEIHRHIRSFRVESFRRQSGHSLNFFLIDSACRRASTWWDQSQYERIV